MMNPRSITYVVIAVAVGYLLVSAVPRQVEMYASPQLVLRGGEKADSSSPSSEDSDSVLSSESVTESTSENMEELKSFDINGEPVKPSLIESTRLDELVKWWTLDVLIALTIYWIAKRRIHHCNRLQHFG